MGVRLDYTITIPSYLYNHAITTGQSPITSNIRAAISSSIQSISHVSNIQTNVFGAFENCGLCQKIAQLWKQFCFAISDCFAQVYRWISAPFTPHYPTINENMSKEVLQKIYLGLGHKKWMEAIDGIYHNLGKYVFDRGDHQGTVEPGFIGSMERAFQFVQNYLNQKIDADWYLKLHKQTCAHFNGDPRAFLMGQEKVEVFRALDDNVGCTLAGVYAVTPEARVEFQALDEALKREFGASYGLGEMVDLDDSSTSTRLNYKAMSRAQVCRIFNKFLNEFYQEIDRAVIPDQKLWAIAKLHQRLEWLHPVRDGTSRTSTALMNKFLTDYGFHPAILEYPHVSSSYGLVQWKQYLQNGLLKWEQVRATLPLI